MADKIVIADPTKPGVMKIQGPTMVSGKIPLNGLDPTGASNGDVIALSAGAWTHSAAPPSADTASNLGGGAGVFSSKVGNDFQFKSLLAGANITITPAGTEITISSASLAGYIVIIVDQKAQNTNGGTFTSGAWRTRDLNTELADTGNLATIAANQVTLAAGTYRCLAILPSSQVNANACRLQNITDGTTLITGSSEYSAGAVVGTTSSFIVGRFTIAAPKVIEVQHQCLLTQATTGFGIAANFQTETYTQLILWPE